MDGKSGTGTGKGCRMKSGSEREKAGTGKKNFSRNRKEKDHFSVPVNAYRGNPNGTSCFPVRRTGTLLVPNKRQMRKRIFTTVR